MRVFPETIPGKPGSNGRPSPHVGAKRGLESFLVDPGKDSLSEAFDHKFTVHAGQNGRPLTFDEVPTAYDRLLDGPPEPLAVYLHMPFCQGRCLYCGFAGIQADPELQTRYAAAMAEELTFLAHRRAASGPIQTVYLGGGTPSCMDPDDLALVMEALERGFTLANDCEKTLEGRAHDFSAKRVDSFLDAGFNRFSLGVQTFDTKVRRSLGRRSSGPEVEKLLKELVERRMATVVIDLIYGLPGHSEAAFLEDLRAADRLGLDGLDVYQLNVFPGGDLAKAVESGRVPRPAPLTAQGRYYVQAAELLLNMGWRQLSLSHFGRGSRERNLYNPWSKRREPCLGVGAGAGGVLAGHSYYRRPDVEAYLCKAAKGDFSPDFLTAPTVDEALNSFIVGEMEEGRLDRRGLTERFDVNPAPLERLFSNWREAALIELDPRRLTMTLAGRFWGVNLTQAVLETAEKN